MRIRPRLFPFATLMIGALAVTSGAPTAGAEGDSGNTATPIKHVVVIFQENVSFDHYFATYPLATNPAGEPRFTARPGTPSVNGLNGGLLTRNPNSAPPFRLDRSQAHTCDMSHDYTQEQLAFDHGLMDRFPETTGHGTGCANSQVMGYYDGNTVTALWNYAQAFAMGDNAYTTNFGPSTVGALNLVAGNTFGATCTTTEVYCGAPPVGTVTGDPQPAGDKCDTRDRTSVVQGQNVGDLLNAKGVSWGFFEGGFANCKQAHTPVGAGSKLDYIPHHQPFQYFASTANPNHVAPTSPQMVGKQGDAANHQYDLADFFAALNVGNLPAVSFIKAAGYEDGHPGYSDPLDEQFFVVNFLNALQRTRFWHDTAVVVSYDDTDGWYDHVMSPIVDQSQTRLDALSGAGMCGSNPSAVPAGQQARCGYGGRMPLLVISPFAKSNFVDGTTTDQSSILKLIEDNWQLGRVGSGSTDAYAGTLMNAFAFRGADSQGGAAKLFLDPCTGQRVDDPRAIDPTGYTATYSNTCV